MTHLLPSTTISFMKGGLNSTSKVIAALPYNTDIIVITDSSPFHPVDHIWPDQPGDIGTMALFNQTLRVETSVVVTQSTVDGRFEIDKEITAKRFDTQWHYFVGHIISKTELSRVEPETTNNTLVAQTVELTVNDDYRRQLSLAHTAGHLASLALNKALSSFWKKPTKHDALENPNFSAHTIVQSRIEPLRTTDIYRLGKSLRKKHGFSTADAIEQKDAIVLHINEIIAQWLETGSAVAIRSEGDVLTSTKMWQCTLDGHEAEIPCGGTHASTLGAFKSIQVTLDLSAEGEALTMLTIAEPH